MVNEMNDALHALGQNIVANAAIYIGGIVALFVAFVCTWPAGIPRSAQEWWTWFRDAFQTAVPAARAATHVNGQASPPNPQPPAGPAQPQK